MNDPITTLTARLDAGWLLIDQEPDPRRRHELENHWLRLLAEYEMTVDTQRPARPAPIPITRRAA